jgi:hypothetical protein
MAGTRGNLISEGLFAGSLLARQGQMPWFGSLVSPYSSVACADVQVDLPRKATPCLTRQLGPVQAGLYQAASSHLTKRTSRRPAP